MFVKYIIFVCVGLGLGVFPSFADDSQVVLQTLPKKLSAQEKALGAGVKFMLNRRCSRYSRSRKETKAECRRAAALLMKVLDARSLPVAKKNRRSYEPNFVGAVFANETLAAIAEPGIQEYIRVTADFVRAHRGGVGVANLWDWTLTLSNQDPVESLRRIALLFQDTDAFAYLRFLKLLAPTASGRLLRDLEIVGHSIRDQKVFDLYPTEFKNKIQYSRAQYHFYVIAYAAYKIARELDGRGAPMAAAVPFVFNTTYEYFRHKLIRGLDRVPDLSSRKDREQTRLLDIPYTAREFLYPSDPKKVELGSEPTNPFLYNDAETEYHDMFNDIYLGYAGALFGVRLANRGEPGFPMDYKRFVREFSESPRGFIERHSFAGSYLK
ncbi:MAG: hypothetical protein AB1540_08580 [Bdellovibrionota bacterium]